MFKLSFFVPLNDCDRVKEALFKIGAGKIGNYDSCCWQTQGQGQFRALKGSSPAIGELNSIEYLDENKVEMVCADNLIENAVAELKRVHPYEEVAYEFYKINCSV